MVLPYVTFGGFDQVMRVASDLAAPFFARWLEPEQASRAAEWAVRIVMAYCSDPSPDADLTDPADTGRWYARSSCPASSPCGSTRPSPRPIQFQFHASSNRAPTSNQHQITRPSIKGAAQ